MQSKRTVTSAIVAAALACACAASIAIVPATSAGAATAIAYAPLNRRGPALSVPQAALRAALKCSGNFAGGSLEPVLLSPATGVTPDENYSWNYERAFTAQGRPWCAVTMPFDTEGDIQIAGEYLVAAIRTENAMAHRRIAVLGHSQGGMSMRWALRFWPDTRSMVDDVIGMAGSNHGTTSLATCIQGLTLCPAASWQQSSTARFIAALNSGAETFAGISYTEVFTHTDEVVDPNSTDANSSSALHTGAGMITNASIQDICPLDVNEHLGVGTLDATAYALVIDALDHAGPANVSRIDRGVCQQQFQPGVDPANVNMYIQILSGLPGLAAVVLPDVNLAGVPEVSGEPPVKCYAFASGCA